MDESETDRSGRFGRESRRLSVVAVSSEGKWIIRYKYAWNSRRWWGER